MKSFAEEQRAAEATAPLPGPALIEEAENKSKSCDLFEQVSLSDGETILSWVLETHLNLIA